MHKHAPTPTATATGSLLSCTHVHCDGGHDLILLLLCLRPPPVLPTHLTSLPLALSILLEPRPATASSCYSLVLLQPHPATATSCYSLVAQVFVPPLEAAKPATACYRACCLPPTPHATAQPDTAQPSPAPASSTECYSPAPASSTECYSPACYWALGLSSFWRLFMAEKCFRMSATSKPSHAPCCARTCRGSGCLRVAGPRGLWVQGASGWRGPGV